MNKTIKKYLKDCRRLFPFYGKKERKFFERYNEDISSEYDSNEDIDYNSITEKFGTPKAVLESYISNCDNDYLLNKMKIKAFIKKIFIIIFIFLFIVVLLELYSIKNIINQEIITTDEIIEVYE